MAEGAGAVDESEARERSRRSGRKEVEEGEGDDVRHDQRVPQAAEGSRSSEVDPQQRQCDDSELRAPIGKASESIDDPGVACELPQRKLEKPVDEALLAVRAA